jgi:hypothetical protein
MNTTDLIIRDLTQDLIDHKIKLGDAHREIERLREGIDEVKAYWDGGSAFTLVYHRLAALAASEPEGLDVHE